MTDFKPFAKAVHNNFLQMSRQELYVVSVSGDDLYQAYLESFPEGTNPIYLTRTEHDCSCCENFIRNVGNVVAVKNGKLVSVWDIDITEYPYDVISARLSEIVKSKKITKIFRTSEKSYGNKVTRQLLDSGQVKMWDHFHCVIDKKHCSHSPAVEVGNINSVAGVFGRGLEELSLESFETVIDLIKSKAIYRGEEHLAITKQFYDLKKKYDELSSTAKNIFIWENVNNFASRFKNTVIGTLVADISQGVDLETSVRSFESKVAPANYKRPTALITPAMVKNAIKTINDLDLEDALQRRFAQISDISVNNVLWADNTAKTHMRDGIESLLSSETTSKKTTTKEVKEISIEDFVEKVLPKAVSMDIILNNNQLNKFVSLTAPVHPDSGKLFKWSNDFGWSYDGNITDSIKERVKKAGGNVNAPFRVSLSWFNYDDLDIHATGPTGEHIYYANKLSVLDVDMNAGAGKTRNAVENLAWSKPKDGKYTIWVNQYSARETSDVGFEIEVENNGSIQQFSYTKKVVGNVQIGTFILKNGVIVSQEIASDIKSNSTPQEKWGVKTNTPVRVQMLMNSPNYWNENQVGNKHWFFILENCKNDLPTRGIYNEFLNSSLDKHRKVFEVLGEKTKCEVTNEQLSGVGFSSTLKDSITTVVKNNKFSETYNIIF
jgi:hypothetical protein